VTAREALVQATEQLVLAGCESASVDAAILVAHVLGVSRSELLLDTGQELSTDDLTQLERLVERRALREPLAYVLGEWGFRGLTLIVDSRVLVPRPETEVVVERCLALLAGIAEPLVLDVGTGSGAIALAIADEHPGARVTGIDASAGALEVAGVNSLQTGIAVELRVWDLFQGLPARPWDLVVSNPPYVLPEEIESLEPEVREWEPREALVGVGATEAVARGALDVLRPGGALVLEVAAADGERVARLLRDLGYADVATTLDLAGRDRVVEGVTTSADRRDYNVR
jgi:release factor glutamine methyltransferase